MKSKDTICPVCEKSYFEFPDDYDICPICGWENDGVQRDSKDYWGGANSLSVNASKMIYILLQNEATKTKVSSIIENYNLCCSNIHTQYRGIDHATSDGEKCREAFAEAHRALVFSLHELRL